VQAEVRVVVEAPVQEQELAQGLGLAPEWELVRAQEQGPE